MPKSASIGRNRQLSRRYKRGTLFTKIAATESGGQGFPCGDRQAAVAISSAVRLIARRRTSTCLYPPAAGLHMGTATPDPPLRHIEIDRLALFTQRTRQGDGAPAVIPASEVHNLWRHSASHPSQSPCACRRGADGTRVLSQSCGACFHEKHPPGHLRQSRDNPRATLAIRAEEAPRESFRDRGPSAVLIPVQYVDAPCDPCCDPAFARINAKTLPVNALSVPTYHISDSFDASALPSAPELHHANRPGVTARRSPQPRPCPTTPSRSFERKKPPRGKRPPFRTTRAA